MSSFQPKPVYTVNINGVITEEELKILRKDLNEELGDEYRVILNVELHKYAPKQKYLNEIFNHRSISTNH